MEHWPKRSLALACSLLSLSVHAAAQSDLTDTSKSDKKIIFSKFSASGEVYSRPSGAWWLAPSTHYDAKVPLHLIQIEGAAWTREWIVDEIRTVEAVFAQCSISFFPILLTEVEVKYGAAEMGGSIERGQIEQDAMRDIASIDLDLLQGLQMPRPLVVFRDSQDSYAYAEMTFDGVDASFRPLMDTAFVTSDTRQGWGDTTSTAHELAHILANEPHNDDPDNLLCGDEAWDLVDGCGAGTQLTAQQCQRVGSWVTQRAPQYEQAVHLPGERSGN